MNDSDIWLDLNDHITPINYRKYNIPSSLYIDPQKYFITSGEAVAKSQKLLSDYKKLLQDLTTNDNISSEYIKAIKNRCREISELVEWLKNLKGDYVFLECDWRDRKLYCIPKNPKSLSKQKK